MDALSYDMKLQLDNSSDYGIFTDLAHIKDFINNLTALADLSRHCSALASNLSEQVAAAEGALLTAKTSATAALKGCTTALCDDIRHKVG